MTQILGAIPLLVAIGSGALIPLQAGANAQLGRTLCHPLWAALVSLALAATAILPVLAALRPSLPSITLATNGPWWMWSGGLIGACYITTAIILAPRLGAGAFVGAVVVGQMIAAMAMDHYGIAGFLQRPTTLPRALGATLIVIGVIVMHIARHASIGHDHS